MSKGKGKGKGKSKEKDIASVVESALPDIDLSLIAYVANKIEQLIDG